MSTFVALVERADAEFRAHLLAAARDTTKPSSLGHPKPLQAWRDLDALLLVVAQDECDDASAVRAQVEQLERAVMRKRELLARHEASLVRWERELSSAVDLAQKELQTLPPHGRF